MQLCPAAALPASQSAMGGWIELTSSPSFQNAPQQQITAVMLGNLTVFEMEINNTMELSRYILLVLSPKMRIELFSFLGCLCYWAAEGWPSPHSQQGNAKNVLLRITLMWRHQKHVADAFSYMPGSRSSSSTFASWPIGCMHCLSCISRRSGRWVPA